MIETGSYRMAGLLLSNINFFLNGKFELRRLQWKKKYDKDKQKHV